MCSRSIAISAEGIFAMRPDGGNDTLYDVVMIYDNDYGMARNESRDSREERVA